jgi:hypothetical protein
MEQTVIEQAGENGLNNTKQLQLIDDERWKQVGTAVLENQNTHYKYCEFGWFGILAF